jgi:hypothetical protein
MRSPNGWIRLVQHLGHHGLLKIASGLIAIEPAADPMSQRGRSNAAPQT